MMHNCKKAFIKMFVFAFFLVVFTDKWIYIQKGSTKEVSTEAFHTKERLSFNGKYTLVSSLINRACAHMFFSDVYLQRHGYCTLGEALNRLDFSSAIQDLRRFNYVAKVSIDART